jgi:hypothetical protein
MTVYAAAMQGVRVTLQSAATTGNGTAIAIPTSIKRHTLYITGSDTPSAGAVQPEVAASPDATVWAPIGGGPITVPDGMVAYTFEGEFGAIRCSISTTVTSGSTTVEYEGGH